MTRLDPAAARAITRDWAGAFPGFAVWKPLHLLRRLGPVLQGIALDRSMSADDYLPYAHVHALTREFPVVTLTLAAPLRSRAGVARRIKVADHEREFASAVDGLRGQSPLSLGEPPTVAELLGYYRRFVSEAQRTGLPSGVGELEDLVLIPAAMEMPDTVDDGLGFARQVGGGWSQPPPGWADTAGWLASLEASASDPGRLRDTAVAEIHRRKLMKVPVAWPGVLDLTR